MKIENGIEIPETIEAIDAKLEDLHRLAAMWKIPVSEKTVNTLLDARNRMVDEAGVAR